MERSGENPERCGYCEKIYVNINRIAGKQGSLKKNVEYNKMLFNDGSATYLEVITAQQSLLNAELSKVADDFYKMQAVVNLYYALGGGRY